MEIGQCVMTTKHGYLSDDVRLHCGVCSKLCNVEYNHYSHISYAESLCGASHKFDRVYCPYIEEKWHKIAQELLILYKRCPSWSVANLYYKDYETIIRSRQDKGIRCV